MPEWLMDSVGGDPSLPPIRVLILRLALAMLCGFLVAGVHAFSLGRRERTTRTLPTTLVLLCVLITLVTMAIGNSVARAFGLVGALSIVRFRTVVEDTRDTAFVIFAVVVGMAVGANSAELALVGIPAVTIATLVMCQIDGTDESGPSATLIVRIALGQNPNELLSPVFAKHLRSSKLTQLTTARQGAAIDLTYNVRLKDTEATLALVTELNRVEGLQSVELRQG